MLPTRLALVEETLNAESEGSKDLYSDGAYEKSKIRFPVSILIQCTKDDEGRNMCDLEQADDGVLQP